MRAIAIGATILLPASMAFADVGAQHLKYLDNWRLGDNGPKVIQHLGPPDFVILPTDKSDAGRDLRADGIAKEWVWKVKECQPVRMDFDAAGRSIGVNYSALKGYCLKEVADLLTPGPEAACSKADRQPFCR